MTQEFKDLVADVREQVQFLNELGVETLEANLPDVTGTIAPTTATPVRSAPPTDLKIDAPAPRKPNAGSRLASLPSLNRRAPTSPKMETPREVPAMTPAAPSDIVDTLYGDIRGLPESSETSRSAHVQTVSSARDRCDPSEGHRRSWQHGASQLA